MEKKPSLILRILGWIVALAAIIGGFFKMMHWPGAAPLILLAAFTHLFFYLPLWLAEVDKKDGEKPFIIIQFAATTLFILAQTFKIMHWPKAAILSNLFFWLFLLIVIPTTIWKLVRSSKTSLFKFNNLVLVIYLLAFIQTMLIRVSENNVGAGSIILSSRQAERAYETVKQKSLHLYDAFNQLNDKEKNSFYLKAASLKKLTDSVEKYIADLKLNLIIALDELDSIRPDSFSISDIKRKTEAQIPTEMLVGNDPEAPRKGHFSGYELKTVIERYSDSILRFVDDGNRAFIASGMNLATNNSINPYVEEDLNWVAANFYGYPAITVLITLTNLEFEVKNAETQVLTNLFNNAFNSSKGNVAGKIADLAYKLESEKQSRQIESLEKEKELVAFKIKAKNQEIAERDNAIFWFAIGLAAVCILVFYVIRSNVIRKRINKQLEEQKRTIEEQKKLVDQAYEELHEKNKEVLDSIHYARRIQTALIPTDRHIEKILKQLPRNNED